MRWKKWAFSLLIILYGVTLGALSFGMNGFVNSPDEAANAYFSEVYAMEKSFIVEQTLSQASYGLLHPRSMATAPGVLLPGSFLGLPFFAGLASMAFGPGAIYWVTPVLLVLALFAWKEAVSHLFQNERLGLLATFFFAIHPGVWYYGMRAMMHNVGFLAFLVFAFWFMVRKPLQIHVHKKWLDFAMGGLMVAGALFFRTAEAPWVLVLLAGLAMVSLWQKWVKGGEILAAILGLMVGLAGVLWLNALTFGHPFTTGYSAAESFVEVTIPVSESEEVMPERHQIAQLLLPFGFHERVLLRTSWQYLFLLYPWMSILSLLGILFLLKEKDVRQQPEWRAYLGTFAFLTIWLVLVYGSWVIYDNPDPKAITLANSYVRYWLPIFTMMSVFAAFAIDQLLGKAKEKGGWARNWSVTIILLSLLGFSANLVWLGVDGVQETRVNLRSFEARQAIILEETEAEAIIVVDYADKYLFPHRQVVVPLRDEKNYLHLPVLREIAPLYYYGITLPEEDLRYLQEEKLSDLGLTITAIREIGAETLYSIDYP
jgi:hypothetical protein